LSPAHAYVAASLPRHGGVPIGSGQVPPPLHHAALKGGSTTAGQPATAKKLLNQVQFFALLAGQVLSHRVGMLVQERGIDFEPTDDYLQEGHLGGSEDEHSVAFAKKRASSPHLLSWKTSQDVGADPMGRLNHLSSICFRRLIQVVRVTRGYSVVAQFLAVLLPGGQRRIEGHASRQ
jgi:hypothetical protein